MVGQCIGLLVLRYTLCAPAAAGRPNRVGRVFHMDDIKPHLFRALLFLGDLPPCLDLLAQRAYGEEP